MIFGALDLEKIVQVGDKTRLDANKTFLTPDEAVITLVRIKPSATDIYYDVTSSKYLDWQFLTDGEQVVTLEITTDGAPQEFQRSLTIVSVAADNLFSDDQDLLSIEADVLNYTRNGRYSFLDKHREAQSIILNELDKARIWKDDGSVYIASDIVTIQEFREQSKYLTLQLIFETQSNQIDDIFSVKARKYKHMAKSAAERGALRLDNDGDGIDEDPIETVSITMVKR